jgi:hypothetical protein
MPAHSMLGFGPSNHLFRVSSAFKLFEAGLRSLESSSSGQQRLRIIRVRASIPRIIFIGLVAPPNYSSAGFGPSNHLHRASSASELFECGLRSLESSSSGQQRLRIILVRASVPRTVFFGPTVPSGYSRPGFGPSNHLFRVSSALRLFEAGLRSLESSFSGQQCLQAIRGWASVPRIVFYGLAIPSKCSSLNYGPSKRIPRPPASSFCSSKG